MSRLQFESFPSDRHDEIESIMKLGIHYHICWSDSSLDWKPFQTKQEATEVAQLIKKRIESYTIVERDTECERCREFNSKAFSARIAASKAK